MTLKNSVPKVSSELHRVLFRFFRAKWSPYLHATSPKICFRWSRKSCNTGTSSSCQVNTCNVKQYVGRTIWWLQLRPSSLIRSTDFCPLHKMHYDAPTFSALKHCPHLSLLIFLHNSEKVVIYKGSQALLRSGTLTLSDATSTTDVFQSVPGNYVIFDRTSHIEVCLL